MWETSGHISVPEDRRRAGTRSQLHEDTHTHTHDSIFSEFVFLLHPSDEHQKNPEEQKERRKYITSCQRRSEGGKSSTYKRKRRDK